MIAVKVERHLGERISPTPAE